MKSLAPLPVAQRINTTKVSKVVADSLSQYNSRHPGDFVIEAWKTEKLIRAYAQTKKLDSRLETMSNWAEN